MYITDKYWGDFIGGTDDSLTLVEYLKGKQRKEISVGEIVSDFGLERAHGDFRNPDIPLVYEDSEGWEIPIYHAIDLISDLAALLLECRVNGGVDLCELDGEESGGAGLLRITATAEEHALINRTLMDFASDPLAYDISEMEPEEETREMAAVCEMLRQELYG